MGITSANWPAGIVLLASFCIITFVTDASPPAWPGMEQTWWTTLILNPVYFSPRAMKKKVWGQLLSVNLSQCAQETLTSPKSLRAFFPALCKKIKMVPYGKPMLQRFGNGYLEGYSALQFIETSSITVHCDEVDGRAFVDVFSCKTFNVEAAKKFCQQYFKAKKATHLNFYRT